MTKKFAYLVREEISPVQALFPKFKVLLQMFLRPKLNFLLTGSHLNLSISLYIRTQIRLECYPSKLHINVFHAQQSKY